MKPPNKTFCTFQLELEVEVEHNPRMSDVAHKWIPITRNVCSSVFQQSLFNSLTNRICPNAFLQIPNPYSMRTRINVFDYEWRTNKTRRCLKYPTTIRITIWKVRCFFTFPHQIPPCALRPISIFAHEQCKYQYQWWWK